MPNTEAAEFEVAETESMEKLSAEYRQFLLSRKVWTQAIHRLETERTRLLERVDVSQPDLRNRDWLRLLQIEHEVAMYEICLDRVHERAELCEGVESPEIAERRERFYRLMRGLAKAGNDRAGMKHRDAYIGCVEGEQGWSPERWASEMEAVALEARKQLVAAIAA